MAPQWLVLRICVGQVGSLLPNMAFAALIPRFAEVWGLSAAQSGMVAGAFYAGYAMTVPFATVWTDRIDARRIMLFGSLWNALSTAAFGLFADGFVSALCLWALAGAGFGGAYMPGLRALTDRLPPGDHSRSITWYTSSYSVGIGASFLLAQSMDAAFGWRAAFFAVACGPVFMAAVAMSLPAFKPQPAPGAKLLDFRPVVRNRSAMAYILAYGVHCFEMAAMRSWLVSLWIFSAARGSAPDWLGPVLVSVFVTLSAMPASILGNELALRLGRVRLVSLVMTLTGIVAGLIALLVGSHWSVVLPLLLLYGFLVPTDSGSLTSGMMGASAISGRGATMALHSTVGFFTSFLGPLAMGLALDAGGGPQSELGWHLGYALLAACTLPGLLALRLAPKPA